MNWLKYWWRMGCPCLTPGCQKEATTVPTDNGPTLSWWCEDHQISARLYNAYHPFADQNLEYADAVLGGLTEAKLEEISTHL